MRRALNLLCLFVLFVAMTVWLPSCGREPLPPNEETQAEIKDIAFTLDDSFTVVRGELAEEIVVNAASTLRRALADATGGSVRISDDWLAPGAEAAQKEILVGVTNRAESEDMRWDDYRIFVQEGRLCIWGGSGVAVSAAVDALVEGWLSGTPEAALTLTLTRTPTAPEGELLSYSGDYAAREITVDGVSLRDCVIAVSEDWPVYLDDVYLREARKLSDGLRELCGWRMKIVRSSEAGQGVIRLGNPGDDPLCWRMTGAGIEAGSSTAAAQAVAGLLEAARKEAKRSPDGFALEALGAEGDVSDILTTPRAEGTDLRVMNSNVLWAPPENAMLHTNTRMAVIAETFSLYQPDIFTLQEMEETIKEKLLPMLTPEGSGYAIAPSDGWSVIVYNENVLTLLECGYEYFEPFERSKGFAWAVFETAGGKRLLVTDAHYVLNPGDNDAAAGNILRKANSEQLLDFVSGLREKYACGAIAAGDYYYGKGSPAYETIIAAGYADPAYTATQKKMGNVQTHHVLGMGNEAGNGIDVILATAELVPLCHRIMVRNPYLMHSTDHTPEYVDFAFAE